MAQMITAESPAPPRQKLPSPCGSSIKASLTPQEGASGMRDVAAESVRRLGKQSAAATDIGLSEGRLSHKLSDGTLTLRELERLGPSYAAEFGRQLLERFGPLSSPMARARQKVREMRTALDDLDQFLEHIA